MQKNPIPDEFVIETNRLQCSVATYVKWLERRGDVKLAEKIPGHKTLFRVKGPTTIRMQRLLDAKLHPRRGSALVIRHRAGIVEPFLYRRRGNRQWVRLDDM